MEDKILESVSEITNMKGGIKGFVCSDENGLKIAQSGEAPKDSSGYVSSLASTAEKLHEDETPSILIETTTRKILIKKDKSSKISVCVIKEKENQKK